MLKRNKKTIIVVISVCIAILYLSYPKIAFWLEYNDQILTIEIKKSPRLEKCDKSDMHFRVSECSEASIVGQLVLPVVSVEDYQKIYDLCPYGSATTAIVKGYLSKDGHQMDDYGCQHARKILIKGIDTIYCSM